MKTLTLSFLFLFSSLAFAAPQCEYLKKSKNGPDKSVNVVFVPSGFNGDMVKFKREVKKIAAIFNQYVPFNEQVDTLNLAISTQETFPNNICHYNCNNIERLLCCDTGAAKLSSGSCTSAERQTVVIHNDTKYGGAGYSGANVATTSINERAPTIAIHELGHSLFNLGDEYTSGWAKPENDPNCSHSGCDKWKDLIDADIPDVTCEPNSCEHGNYFAGGNTIMKHLTSKFMAVNERIACCTYVKSTGEFPKFCSRFKFIGEGLDKFCGLKIQKEAFAIERPLELEYARDKDDKWVLVGKRELPGKKTYDKKLVATDEQKMAILKDGSSFDDFETVEYFGENGPQHTLVKKKSLKLIIDQIKDKKIIEGLK